MELKDLYELIRKEPVCLFIGSGFSLYAGMPSASNFIEILKDDLTVSQRKKFNQISDLRKFTDDYEVLFGRHKLIGIIQKHFDIVPTDTHLHELLAKIPYFKTIITTNYDRLIENAMGNNAAVLVKDADVFIPKQAKCRIFKIHGDVRDADSIVISDTDYSKHYNRNFKDPFWASVIAEISSKHIVFLGYGYEDDNVWSDFDHIEEKLKSKDKKRILISPGVKAIKQKKLKKLKIDYIRADGEMFISGLIADIKSNIVEDHRLGIADTQTAQDFITAFDMKVASIATKDAAGFTEISRVNGPTQETIMFTTSDQDLIASYQKFTNGYQIRDLRITSEQLQSFSYLIEDFNFLGKNELSHLNVSHVPKFEGNCKVHFPDDDFTLYEIHCRFFNSIPGHVLIELEISGFKAEFILKIKNSKPELNFKFIEPELPVSIYRTYEVMRAFFLFFSGHKAEIITYTGEVIHQQLTAQGQATEFGTEMEIFHTLTKIEKSFDINLAPLSLAAVTDEDKRKIQKLRDLIDHGYYAIKEKDGIIIEQMPDSEEMFEGLKSPPISESYVSLVTKSGRELELFGHILELGAEQVSMKQPKPVILDFENLRAQFIPIDHVLVYHYEKFGHWEMQNSKTLWGEKN